MFAALRGPDSIRLFVSSMVGRTPAVAMGLVIVLRAKELTGSFASGRVAVTIHRRGVGDIGRNHAIELR